MIARACCTFLKITAQFLNHQKFLQKQSPSVCLCSPPILNHFWWDIVQTFDSTDAILNSQCVILLVEIHLKSPISMPFAFFNWPTWFKNYSLKFKKKKKRLHLFVYAMEEAFVSVLSHYCSIQVSVLRAQTVAEALHWSGELWNYGWESRNQVRNGKDSWTTVAEVDTVMSGWAHVVASEAFFKGSSKTRCH